MFLIAGITRSDHLGRIGLNQIINRRYDAKIKEYQHVKNIIKIAMAFCGKKVDLQYQIDSIIR